MRKFFQRLINYWNQDRSLTSLMLLLMLFIFILVPLVKEGRIGELILKGIYSVILITGILSVTKKRRYWSIAILLGFIGLCINWLSEVKETEGVLIASDLGAILFNLFFALVILFKTFQPGEITFYRVEGSVVVYLLIGLVFGYIFHLLYLIGGPTAFNNVKGSDLNEFLYFSFTSLTTMGYGDITPVHPLARSLANFEAVVGQLYPAILIARLVSMEFESSSRKNEKN